tara:strand:- start:428 stop:541 length:114 start_codon:yes stop_codon:yes gene_type:complete
VALITIETMDDEEATLIKDIVDNIGFSTTIDVKYEDE